MAESKETKTTNAKGETEVMRDVSLRDPALMQKALFIMVILDEQLPPGLLQTVLLLAFELSIIQMMHEPCRDPKQNQVSIDKLIDYLKASVDRHRDCLKHVNDEPEPADTDDDAELSALLKRLIH